MMFHAYAQVASRVRRKANGRRFFEELTTRGGAPSPASLAVAAPGTRKAALARTLLCGSPNGVVDPQMPPEAMSASPAAGPRPRRTLWALRWANSGPGGGRGGAGCLGTPEAGAMLLAAVELLLALIGRRLSRRPPTVHRSQSVIRRAAKWRDAVFAFR